MEGSSQLIGMIVETFDDWPPPTEVVSDTNGPFADETTKNFLGKLWQQVITKNLSCHADAMVYFTPEAHRYYLPAFMVLALASPKDEDFADHILFHFSKHQDPFWSKRINCFDPKELDLIGEFLNTATMDIDREQLGKALKGLELAKANKSLNTDASNTGAG